MTARIVAAANDAFRRQLTVAQLFANAQRHDGRFVMTSGVALLDATTQLAALRKVASFDSFTPDNDPHGEHDFGAFEVDGSRFFFKFDYYDSDAMEFGAENPATSCYRVLVVMLAEEYEK